MTTAIKQIDFAHIDRLMPQYVEHSKALNEAMMQLVDLNRNAVIELKETEAEIFAKHRRMAVLEIAEKQIVTDMNIQKVKLLKAELDRLEMSDYFINIFSKCFDII
jgi:hypothetical protein